MNLIYAEIIEIHQNEGMSFAKVRVGGAMANALLDLVADAEPGDRVLLCDGAAIGKVENGTNIETPSCASQSQVN